MSKTLYSAKFFKSCSGGSLLSAKQIVPHLKRLTECDSVIDVGCGLGTWLSVFNECGVTDFQGIDGGYINQENLLIPRNRFIAADLTNPPQIQRQFDLAICLEVAEHLPSTAETTLIDFLTGLSSIVAFSASIPFQNGTAHINEQWLEHWVQHFRSRGYVAIDCIRPRFWSNPDVEWWYAQNTILYAKEKALDNYPHLSALCEKKDPFSCVHPRLLLYKQDQITNMPMKQAWRLAFNRTWKAVLRRLKTTSAPK
jgi:SAM-dependent methyltransferase